MPRPLTGPRNDVQEGKPAAPLLHDHPRADAEARLEGAVEGGVVVEAAQLRGLDRGDALADQPRRVHEALLPDSRVHRAAGLLLEQAHKMIAAHKDPLGQIVDRQLRAEVLVDDAQRLADLRVAAALEPGGLRLAQARDVDQQLHDQGLAHRPRAEARVLRRLLIGRDRALELGELLLVRAQQMPPVLVRLVEAVQEPRPGHGPPEVARVEIEDDALVGLAPVDDRLVDRVVPHEEHRPGREGVAAVLHKVVDPPLDQDDQLVELVEMVVQLLSGAVAEVKVVVALLQIARPVDAVFAVQRAPPPFVFVLM